MNPSAALFRIALVSGVSLSAPTACSRSVPTQYPTRSALSPRAPAAVSPPVTLAMDADPPLPGEPEGAWGGLRDPQSAADGGPGAP